LVSPQTANAGEVLGFFDAKEANQGGPSLKLPLPIGSEKIGSNRFMSKAEEGPWKIVCRLNSGRKTKKAPGWENNPGNLGKTKGGLGGSCRVEVGDIQEEAKDLIRVDVR